MRQRDAITPFRSSLLLLVSALLVAASPAAAPSAPPAPSPSAAPALAIPAPARTVADRFFTDPALAETRAIIVHQDGKRVYERYAPGYGPGNRFISWSMAKSLTSTIIGMLVADGKLQLDAPAPVPAWHKTPGDPRAAITLRHLLHMSSGLKHNESEPEGSAETNRGLFSDKSGDIAAFAVSARLESKPGTVFNYSTLTSHILADIAIRTIAPIASTPKQRRAAMRQFIIDRLSGPAGMPSLICEYDPAGTLLGGSLCHATARDWANFGQLYLDHGTVAGREVISPTWVDFVRTPSKTNIGYGGHFWLNRAKPGQDSGLFADQGPPDAFSANGHLGQYVIIVPSKVALGKLVNAFPAAS